MPLNLFLFNWKSSLILTKPIESDFVCISEKYHGEMEAQHSKQGLSFTTAGNFTDKMREKKLYLLLFWL